MTTVIVAVVALVVGAILGLVIAAALASGGREDLCRRVYWRGVSAGLEAREHLEELKAHSATLTRLGKKAAQ